MPTYLLTWKATEWGEEHLKACIERFNAGEHIQRWSCGTTREIPIGSRVFLMRQGSGHGGLFGAGHVTQGPFEAEHYNEHKRNAGKSARYILVQFEQLFDPASDIKVNRDELMALDDKLWRFQGSGKRIPEAITTQLETLWSERVGRAAIPYAEEIQEPDRYFEGARKSVTVNAYERDPRARAKCLSHWGTSCCVCGFHFEYFYGEMGKGYIHVHHLKPLSTIGGEYALDPVNDLRPVCPNCHAMLHRTSEVLSIEELRSKVQLYGKR